MCNTFCVYVTKHPTGKFYIGKGVTSLAESGKYKGSGTILLDAFKKYPKSEWSSTIISVHEREQDAYLAEGLIVNEALLQNPECLNINLGGKGGCRRKQSPEEIANRRLSIIAGKSSIEHRAHMSEVSRDLWKNEDYRNKLTLSKKQMRQDEEFRERILKIRANAPSKWNISLSVDGEKYRSESAACRDLNIDREALRKLPGYKRESC